MEKAAKTDAAEASAVCWFKSDAQSWVLCAAVSNLCVFDADCVCVCVCVWKESLMRGSGSRADVQTDLGNETGYLKV